ncbi:unnamed protein product [Peronospora destructor]|uniref:Uncharacterized protein n=1 Tax=Peronospora destructor TaxID=86335 RepID=A0AAV0UXR9_9STRA|nr:unnamed protein product [Peronospora destructor]
MNAAFTTHVEKTPSDVLLADTFVDWNEGLSLILESTSEVATACQNASLGKFEEDIETEKDEGEERKKKDVEQVEDTLNVDDFNELFSYVEQKGTDRVDINVFREDKDDISVEKISQMFSCCDDSKACSTDQVMTLSRVVDVVDMKQLKFETDVEVCKSLELVDSSFSDVAASRLQEKADAENVAMLSEIFPTLEDKDSVESVGGLSTWDSLADCQDVNNVELMTDSFTALEEHYLASQEMK